MFRKFELIENRIANIRKPKAKTKKKKKKRASPKWSKMLQLYELERKLN